MSEKDKLKDEIKQAFIDAVNNNKDQIISQIVNQKRIMFDTNSHNWQPLLPQTIARKKRYSDPLRGNGLFRQPESINIRKGGLFKIFINPNSYKTSSNKQEIDFNIELDDFSQFKTNIVALHDRDVVEVTQGELNRIADNLTDIITKAIKQKYSQ